MNHNYKKIVEFLFSNNVHCVRERDEYFRFFWRIVDADGHSWSSRFDCPYKAVIEAMESEVDI